MSVQQVNIHEALQEEFLPYAGESLINFFQVLMGYYKYSPMI